MPTATRIYVVAPKTSEEPVKRRLVRAANQSAALRHISDEFIVALASQDDIVDCVAAGVKVEETSDV